MKHQVFIERCRDQKSETAKALALAVATRYGIDPAQIEGRLQKGRFQVKANLDIESARSFVSYLEAEGALCSIVDQAGQIVMRSAALATPVSVPSTERDEVSMPAFSDDEFALHTPPPPPDYSSSDYESGLSAGFGASSSAQSLGALDDLSATASSSFQLAALDGTSGEAPAARAAGGTNDVDAFLPPDMLQETALELDVPEKATFAEASVMAPALGRTPASTIETRSSETKSSETKSSDDDLVDQRESNSRVQAAPLPARALGLVSRNARVRFALGVALAVMLGFVAVHFFASGREADRYGTVLSELRAEYAAANSQAAWSSLDEARTHALSSLKDRRSTIVVTSTLIWLAIAGLLLFAWLRLIDWTRWQDLGLPETIQAE